MAISEETLHRMFVESLAHYIESDGDIRDQLRQTIRNIINTPIAADPTGRSATEQAMRNLVAEIQPLYDPPDPLP